MSIIDKILLSEGMTKEELAYHRLPISEKRKLLPNPLMPAGEAFILEGALDAFTVTRVSGEQLCREGIELGIITEQLPIPCEVESLPSEAVGQECHQNFVSPMLRGMNGKYRAMLSSDGVVRATNISTHKEYVLDKYLTLSDTPALYDFIMNGGTAILDIWMFSVTWISEENHQKIQAYQQAAAKYSDIYSQWWRLFITLRDRKDPVVIARAEAKIEAARKQAESEDKLGERLNNLPFKWESAIKEVLSGLSENSNGSGCRENTVVHVRLLEDYKGSRFERKRNDYLCTPKKVSNWADGDWSGMVVTCKACIKKVEALDRAKAKTV